MLKFHQFYSAILLQKIRKKLKGDITMKKDIPLETLKIFTNSSPKADEKRGKFHSVEKVWMGDASALE